MQYLDTNLKVLSQYKVATEAVKFAEVLPNPLWGEKFVTRQVENSGGTEMCASPTEPRSVCRGRSLPVTGFSDQ